ncbi:MAG: glycosyltransferase family 2 protein [Ruminococcus sp.]
MITERPELSIIVPVYNVELYLEECLNSILHQTFVNWECILIDDGSKDWSGFICDNYSKKDDRFKVVHQKNSGVSVARNLGIELASAPLISFIDSDDYISLNYYAKMIECVKVYNAECVCSNRCFVINDKETTEENIIMNELRRATVRRLFVGKEVTDSLRLLVSGGPWGYVFSKELWNGYRFPVGFDFAEDVAVIPSVITSAKRAIFEPEAVYFYRKRPKSLMTQPVDKNRFIRCLKATNIMYNDACLHHPDQLHNFRTIKFNSDIDRFIDYLKGNPSINGSRLHHLWQLAEETKGDDTQ